MPSAPGDQGPLSAEFDARVEPGLLLSAIVDSTADMIWSIDAEGFRLLSTNRSLREYLRGRGFEVRPGMTPEECVPAPEAETWRAYYRRALREGPYSIEHVTAVGDRFLELHFSLIEREGRAIAISVFGRDITERRGAADRLRGSEAFFRALPGGVAGPGGGDRGGRTIHVRQLGLRQGCGIHGRGGEGPPVAGAGPSG